MTYETNEHDAHVQTYHSCHFKGVYMLWLVEQDARRDPLAEPIARRDPMAPYDKWELEDQIRHGAMRHPIPDRPIEPRY